MKRFTIVTAKKYIKKDGTQGNKWVKLGNATQKEDGTFFGEIDSIPVGTWFDGAISIFPVEQQGQNNQSQPQQQQGQSNNYNQNNYGNYQG